MTRVGYHERRRTHATEVAGRSKYSLDKCHGLMKKHGVFSYLFLPIISLDGNNPTTNSIRLEESKGFLLFENTMNTQNQDRANGLTAHVVS